MSARTLPSTLLSVGRVTRRCDQCRTSFSISAQQAFGEHAQRFCTARCRSASHTARSLLGRTTLVDCAVCGEYGAGYRLAWLITELPLCVRCETVLRISCWRKTRYDDPGETVGARRWAGQERVPLFAYECELCFGWHRTKQPESRMLFAGQRGCDDDAALLVALRVTLEGFGVVRGRDVVRLPTPEGIMT